MALLNEESQGISLPRPGVNFYKNILRTKNPKNEPYPIVRLIGHRGSASKAVQSVAKTVSELKHFFLSNPDVFVVSDDYVILSKEYCTWNKKKQAGQRHAKDFSVNSNTIFLSNGGNVIPHMKSEFNPSKDIDNSALTERAKVFKAVAFYFYKLFDKSAFASYPLIRLIGHRGTASTEIQNIAKNSKELKTFLQNFPKLFNVSQGAVAVAKPATLEVSVLLFYLVECINKCSDYEVSLDNLIKSRSYAPLNVQKLITNSNELKNFLSKYNDIVGIRGSSIILNSEFVTKIKNQPNNLKSFVIVLLCHGIVSKELKNFNITSLKTIPSVVAESTLEVHSTENNISFTPSLSHSVTAVDCVKPAAVEFFIEKLWKFGLCHVVAIKDLFKYKFEASQEVQEICGNSIEEFKNFLCQHPHSFIVTNENVLARRNVPRKKWSPVLNRIEEPACNLVLNFFKMYSQNGKPEHIEKLYSNIGKCFTRNDGELLFRSSKDLSAFLEMFPQFFCILENQVFNIFHHDKESLKGLSDKRNSRVKSKDALEYEPENMTSAIDGLNNEDWKKDVLKNTIFVDSINSCQDIVSRIIKKENVIALDCEGLNLGADGNLSLIQIAKKDGQVYVFDVYRTPELIISGNLKSIFESNKILKVIHDCRNDSANLYHEYKVTLKKIFDTRIAHAVISNSIKGKNYPSIGFNKLCKIYGAPINPEKDELKDVYKINQAFWLTRPLSSNMLAYAALDVACLMPHVYNAMRLKIGDKEERICQLSEKFSKTRF